MSINNLKGTLYDFLGYFAPGLIAIICAFITILRIHNISNIYETLKNIIKDISALEVFVLIILAYMLGHAIASISSWIIEKKLAEKVKKLKSSVDIENILDDEHYREFCLKYKNVFNVPYSNKSIRRIICYVQSKQNLVYETALIFLSFYGMSRNISWVCGICSFIELYFLWSKKGYICILFMYGLFTLIFLYEYIRFRKYFLDTILSGFLIPGDNEAASWKELLEKPSFIKAINDTDIFVASHHGRESGYYSELFKYFNPKLVIVSDGPEVETSVTDKYSKIASGWNIYKRSENEKIPHERKCLTTRKDGRLIIKVGKDNNGTFMNVTTG